MQWAKNPLAKVRTGVLAQTKLKNSNQDPTLFFILNKFLYKTEAPGQLLEAVLGQFSPGKGLKTPHSHLKLSETMCNSFSSNFHNPEIISANSRMS